MSIDKREKMTEWSIISWIYRYLARLRHRRSHQRTGCGRVASRNKDVDVDFGVGRVTCPTSCESLCTASNCRPALMIILSPVTSALYSATLFETGNWKVTRRSSYGGFVGGLPRQDVRGQTHCPRTYLTLVV